MIPEVVAELAQVLAEDWLPGGLEAVDLHQHRFGSNRSRASDGQDVHRRLRRCSSSAAPGMASPAARPRSRWRAIAEGYGVPPPGVFVIPEPNAYRRYISKGSDEESALANLELALKMFDMQSSGRARAAIIAEPDQRRRVLVPPKAFMEALRRAADERGMLPIFDEAQTAFGRIGKKTRIGIFRRRSRHHDNVETLGGRLAAHRGLDHRSDREQAARRSLHYYTSHVLRTRCWRRSGSRYSRVITEEKLVARANVMGSYPRDWFEGLQQKYEQIGDIRGGHGPSARRRACHRSPASAGGPPARRADDQEVLRIAG